MCRRKANQKRNINGIKGFGGILSTQLIRNGKEGQDEEAVIFSFIAQIGDALFGQGIIFSIPENIVHIKCGLCLLDTSRCV